MAKRPFVFQYSAAVVILLMGAYVGHQFARSEAIRGAGPGEPFTLVGELDATAAHPFAGEPVIRGVLQPGTDVRVRMRKGDLVYVDVEAVFTREAFDKAVGNGGR